MIMLHSLLIMQVEFIIILGILNKVHQSIIQLVLEIGMLLILMLGKVWELKNTQELSILVLK